MKVHRGKVHKYLGMSLDFTNKGQCIVMMNDYLADIVKAYDLAIAKHDDGFLPITQQRYKTPAPENLFTVNEDCEKLPKEMAADFQIPQEVKAWISNGSDVCQAYVERRT